jgi:DNA-binding transcriptional MocR family regulator
MMIVMERYQVEGRTAAEISASVESGVRAGALAPGAALPPVRELARQLGLSPATVARAYQDLRGRGMLETAGRRGTRVRHRPPVAVPRAASPTAVPAGVRDLSAGEPDRRLLPALGPHLAALAAGYPTGLTYSDGGPLPELVAAARARLDFPAPALTVTGGALDGIERLLGTTLRPGDAVAVEDPGWANLLDLVATLGLRPVPVEVDDEGPTPAGLAAALRAGARAAVVTSRAQNPTGAAISAARAARLRQVLAGRDVLLVEDDHAAEIASHPLHPLAGATQRWAFLRSASKPFGPDLRIAVLAGDEATVARVDGRLRIGSGWVSTVLQRLLLRMWEHADPEPARAAYDRRRDALRDALTARGLPARAATGINVWVPVDDETGAVGALREAGWAVAPGARHRLHSPPGIRITVSALDLSDVEPLADAVAAAAVPGAARFTR